ncbi:putative transmembrane protein [Hirsutella rhossiliensis]|uniref:Transmembrane protein n=1 Tax=Hirsutella rhossiliensis TaxID=111463 RepID=A0A9P8SL53_9HYPO|nr:putative transmembrane protein [Hirsutella rhossiliensis]KAH0965914.1 putative transmembrane protein [Hirsutella rhossiliensis]
MSNPNNPPPGYRAPPFPSLSTPMLSDKTPQRLHTIYYIEDAWRFTLLWTLITYAVFHVGAVLVAVVTHGWKKSSWSYLWAVPGVYLVVAGLEAVLAGSVVGLVLGAVYRAGYYEMNTWIPCTWGIINVLTLVISSFSIQGGL